MTTTESSATTTPPAGNVSSGPATRWAEPPRPRHAGDVAVGDELPVMTKQASRAQLFLYSAITWNPHRIHYDRDYAQFEGHPDVIVHGPLQGSWLTQYLTDWAGPGARIVSVGWQNRASALPERDVVFRGTVTGVDDDVVHLDLQVHADDGRLLMPGRASVRLPRRG